MLIEELFEARSDTIVYSIRPSEASEDELWDFYDMLIESGEVMSAGLMKRIKNAVYLIFMVDGDRVVGIGGVKIPLESYKRKVFYGAGVPELMDEYDYEIGWIYITPEYRGNGIFKFIKELKRLMSGKKVFATTREDNKIIRKVFERVGIKQLGEAYRSTISGNWIVLYGN